MNSTSKAAIARLRSYRPPPTQYYSLPLSRRAAVLVLLYADKRGELQVILTLRARTLSSYAGEAALPGGKADSLRESPYETARREAFEEIGLPQQDAEIPAPFRIRSLCQLPISVAATWLGVCPCVALVEADASLQIGATDAMSAIEGVVAPKLDANEVAAVFTAPLEAFLDTSLPAHMATKASGHSQPWYKGNRFPFDNGTVRMYNFYMPIPSSSVTWTGIAPDSSQVATTTFRIFGLTAKILVETARIAFDREPRFEHDAIIGDERRIRNYIRDGKMGDQTKGQAEETKEKAKM